MNFIKHTNEFDIFQVQTDEVVSQLGQAQADEWRLLRRLRLPDQLNRGTTGNVRRGLIADVETTGLSLVNDEVVQIGLLPFTYEPETGRILNIDHANAYEGIREPGVPISEEATLISGLTQEMLVGKEIQNERVEDLVEQAGVVIAHNAKFDRVMVEKLWPAFASKHWGCTFTGVDWLREGFTAGKLDYLGYQFGWFFQRHRALSDCEACLSLLAQSLPSQKTVLEEVRTSALKKEYLIPAVGSPFEAKDILKERGYQWRGKELPNGGVWWTIVGDPESEFDWLHQEIYRCQKNLPIIEINALNRYSERIWKKSP